MARADGAAHPQRIGVVTAPVCETVDRERGARVVPRPLCTMSLRTPMISP